ncbi:DNA polymerase alpha subunit A [Pancytospora epiphaga]|nr:DNA polymerase alpha subunit A [Pancytospora epiphaga]
MEFQIYNIEKHTDTEALIYGKIVGNDNLPTSALRVTNIVSNVLFLASPGHKEDLISELREHTKDITEITEVTRHNIFFKSMEHTLNLLQVSFRKPVSFKNFESDFCDFVHTEFSSPVENLIISRGLRGNCLAKINLPNVTFDCTGKMVTGKKGAAPVIGSTDISYLGTGKLSNLLKIALDLESKNGNVIKFTVYDGVNIVKGTLEEYHVDCRSYDDNDDLVGEFVVDSGVRIFKSSQDLFKYLNEYIEKYDVVVYHNYHNKYRLNLKGKIICDLFDFASGNLKGKDFSVAELAGIYGMTVNGTEEKAVVLMELFERMNALGLAKELSEISGCPINKCLENSRLERIEYALLHELYAGGYLFPPVAQKRADKYTGGLVLEPIQGFYEDIVLLLDFNSLYPSIIQEFNVCFSTVGFEDENEEFCDDAKENIVEPSENHLIKKFRDEKNGSHLFLPSILRNLVKRRAEVKALLKNVDNDDERTVLDVRQKAIKLTANSIYGCLGSPSSRFCNYQMASYITAKGRELLGMAKFIAESLGLRVIYGDTDSIMIHTSFPGQRPYVERALESAKNLVNEINSRYTHIEIEIEKVFKKLLLITKKKYAALVFDEVSDRIEVKGLDTMRRDFCRASTELSRKVLEIILEEVAVESSGMVKSKAERVYDLCENCVVSLRKYPIEMFVAYSSFSKDPSLYNTAALPPHVSLALRLEKMKGVVYKQNDVIPFVIGEGHGQLNERVFHPDEKCIVDYNYYVKSQILPPLLRLVSLWPEVSSNKLELIFGLSEAKKNRSLEVPLLKFITECCKTVQTPARLCGGCRKEIADSFYVERVVKLLEEQCCLFYKTTVFCPICDVKYYNHAQRCFYCGKELLFNPPNQKFDDFLILLENSFKTIKIQEISDLVSLYSGQSAHRIVDFSLYFSEEIEDYVL